MKITILVYGSLGDVQPYVALGAGLKRAGYDVEIAADPYYASLVSDFGLKLASVSGNPVEIFQSKAAQTVADSDAGIFKRMFAYGAFNREMKEHIAKNLADSWTACGNADVLIFSFNAFGGYHIAEKLGVPAFAVAIAPFTRTRTMPSINFASRPRLGAAYNVLTHVMTERLFFLPPASKKINLWRKESLDLKPLPAKGYMRRLSLSPEIPVLYSFSPAIVPPPADWPEWAHITGYWFPEPDPEWQPPQELADFLAAGPPPVYIGFGSMASKANGSAPEARLQMIFDALDQAGERGIVSAGADADGVPFPSTVLRVGSLPHDWLFRHVSMTIHHGGCGTIAQSARAGVPMVIVPFMWDQPFWARRMESLGLAHAPISHKHLNSQTLAQAIRSVLDDSAMRDHARRFGEKVREENGVARAVDLINERLRAKGIVP
ncbi:MAG TPA: glycosyltransferase [Acidobacteriaceae bacterium]|jgi:sterol 3beta-glucosyltransferase|nr:glycosyltransferase [Acidobacteriaceae bacterium]